MAITIVNQSVADVTYKVFGGSASGIVASGSPSFTVALDWVKAPSLAVSASGVVTISTSVKG